MVMEIKYDTCQNCKGNGYVRIIPYSETQTCKECSGAGYFKPISNNNESRLKDNHPMLNKVDDGEQG